VWLIVVRQSAADRAKMAGVHTISITPEALLYSSEHNKEKTAWLGLQRIVVTDEHIFFFIMSQAGHAIPRRAFASDEAFHEFAETAQRYKEEANEKAQGDMPESTGTGSPEWRGPDRNQFRSPDYREHIRADEPRPSKDPE